MSVSRIHGLVLRVLRNSSQAEEVTQEAFLEFWLKADAFDPGRGTALNWMMTIARRRAIDRVRGAQAAIRRDAVFHQQHRLVDHDSTSEVVHASLEADRVRSALTVISSVQREALVLVYLRGHTHTEVARLLDVPLGTVKGRIRDGLVRLRHALDVGR